MSNKIIKQQNFKESQDAHSAKISIALTAVIIMLLCCLSFLLLGKTDTAVFLKWQLCMMFFTLMSLPLSRALFQNCMCLVPFGKTLSIIIPGFLMWATGCLLNIPFNRVMCLVSIFIYMAFNIIFAKKQHITSDELKNDLKNCIKYEAIFFGVFLFWTYLIGFNPAAYGTEKFMDYAFLQKMLTTTKLPPDDVWFAGKSINYYYGGQYYAAFIAKLIGGAAGKAEYAYNMMRALIPALMFTGVYEIVEQLLKDRAKRKINDSITPNKKAGIRIQIFAVLSAIISVFAGNGHYIIYGILKPFITLSKAASSTYTMHKDISVDNASYWFPDATRYIGYNPDVATDKTIHEFPCYSFILGDLHAHMINIMIVLLIMALLYSYLKSNQKASGTNIIKQCLCMPQLYIIGIIWGLCNFTNYWDYIIYAVVILVTIIFANLTIKEKGAFKRILSQFGITLIIAWLTAKPFTIHFESIFKGVGVAENHSRLYQLGVLWGIPVAASIVFIVIFIVNFIKNAKKVQINSSEKGIKKKRLKNALYAIKIEDLFVFILSCCAIGLIIIPELIYVRDIYESGNARANTMFKLTYQAFIMFSLCSGYILYILTERKEKRISKVTLKQILSLPWKNIFGYILLTLNILTIFYFFNAAGSWFGNWGNPAERKGTYALNYLDTDEFANEKNAILWLKEKVADKNETKAVAEAPGDSYTAYERVSTITGLSTPAGWTVHEWLWRDDYDAISDRSTDIDSLYTEGMAIAKKVIKKYNIKYIFFGTREKEKYGEDSKDYIKELGKVIYENDESFIVEVD